MKTRHILGVRSLFCMICSAFNLTRCDRIIEPMSLVMRVGGGALCNDQLVETCKWRAIDKISAQRSIRHFRCCLYLLWDLPLPSILFCNVHSSLCSRTLDFRSYLLHFPLCSRSIDCCIENLANIVGYRSRFAVKKFNCKIFGECQ